MSPGKGNTKRALTHGFAGARERIVAWQGWRVCASASSLGGQCPCSAPPVLHAGGLWRGRPSNLCVTLPTALYFSYPLNTLGAGHQRPGYRHPVSPSPTPAPKEAHRARQVGFAAASKDPSGGLEHGQQALRPLLVYVPPGVLFLGMIDARVQVALHDLSAVSGDGAADLTHTMRGSVPGDGESLSDVVLDWCGSSGAVTHARAYPSA
jgi:hypothetical protein